MKIINFKNYIMVTDEELKNALVNNDVAFLTAERCNFDINHHLPDDEDDGDSLLLYAISCPESEVYTYLLEQGADMYATNNLGENILHAIIFSYKTDRMLSIEGNDPHIIEHFINQSSSDGTSPLMLALLLKDYSTFSFLLNKGANVNVADNDGITPLHIASRSEDIKIVKALVEHGAELHVKTQNGNYPLANAVNNNQDEIAQYLFPLFYRD